MNIINRTLTLNENTTTDTVECIAACKVELTALEVASFALGNSFTLRCVIRANDPGQGSDEVRFTFPRTKTFTALVDLLDVDQVFRAEVSRDLLDEDPGSDELRARFRLTNNQTGQTRQRLSPIVQLDE